MGRRIHKFQSPRSGSINRMGVSVRFRARDEFGEGCEAAAGGAPVAFGVRLNLVQKDADFLAAVAFGHGVHGESPFACQHSMKIAPSRAFAARAGRGAVKRCWRRAAALLSCAVMKHWERKMVVIGRLRAKPLLAGQLLCGLAAAGLAVRQASGAWGDGAAEVLRAVVAGNPAVTVLIAAALVGGVHFRRLWRRRASHIRHDGSLLYRGSESWPLALIRDVVVARNGIGIASLRLVVDDDSEVTRALAPLYMLEDSPEAVRGGVMFAVAGVRGFPAGSAMN